MSTLENLKREVEEIQARNKRVEADKAWETSWTRNGLVLALTYFVFVVFFIVARLPDPFVSSVVPAIAFLLSTMGIPAVKKFWIQRTRGL